MKSPATFAYDANGNLTSDGSRSYAFDAENRLVSATGAQSASLSYDPMGRLFQTSGGAAGTTQFLYDGDELIAEYDGAGTLLRRYVHGVASDDPVAWYEGGGLGSRRGLFADHQGSIVAVADGSGNALALNSYDSWGIPGSANQGRFGYTGQAWLPELGMYHYKARIYSPTLGRFLQTDPIGYDDQVNLYAYVGNDPANSLDSSGKEIVLAAHDLAFEFSHTKIVIIPENQDRYKGHPAFENTLPDGRRFATIGGGPEGGVPVGRLNRPTDVDSSKNNFRHVLPLPKGMTEDQMIDNLGAANHRYNDSLDYDLIPTGSNDGYSSNRFAAGVLREAGYKNLPKVGYAPGFAKPIPPTSFDKPLPPALCQRDYLSGHNRGRCKN